MTVTIITQGTNRASLKVRTDTDPVATQESPRGPSGACEDVLVYSDHTTKRRDYRDTCPGREKNYFY